MLNSPADSNNLAFILFQDMQQDNLEYMYRGNFTSNITDTILTLAESNLATAETERKIKKKVYFIMVEGLQNITRHQTQEDSEAGEVPGLFVVQRKKNGYFITTGNLIKQERIAFLKEIIEKINLLTPEQLKDYAREILDKGEMSDKGGAGLGLIEIAKKSGSKLYFDFKKINDSYSYFYMHNKIPYSESDDTQPETNENSLEGIIKMHELLEQKSIILNFSGLFNQDTLINLLAIIEKQLQGTVILKMKVFNLMVEMLQNIVKHADNYTYNDVHGKHAIFYISETEEEIMFTTGNYVQNEKIESLKKRLERINELDKKQLNEFYNQTLFNFEKNSDSHSGLGLIDIKMKCLTKFIHDFFKIDDEFTFFSLQVTIKKMKTSLIPHIVQQEKDTPEIILDSENGIFSFIGRSIPENAVSFYKPVIEWITDYLIKPNDLTEIKFKFDYFNTASAKQIAKIMLLFEKLSKKSRVVLKWHYKLGDHEMMEEGMRYEELTDLKIVLAEDDN